MPVSANSCDGSLTQQLNDLACAQMLSRTGAVAHHGDAPTKRKRQDLDRRPNGSAAIRCQRDARPAAKR